jgi:hypothetical protein
MPKIITVTRTGQLPDTGSVEESPAQRVSDLWDLTLNVWAFVPGNNYAKSRLQRDVAVLTRPQG